MALKVTKVDVWAGDIQDMPGSLASVLAAVAGAGGSVECVVARRDPSRPGMGEIFISPVRGTKVQNAARSAGLSLAADIGTLRVEGADRPGLGSRITDQIADAGINMRGLTAAVVGKNFVAYFGFDSTADADRAAGILKKVNAGGKGAPKRGASRRKGAAGKKTTRRARR